MGSNKDQMMQKEDDRAIAEVILTRAKVAKECPIHSDVLLNNALDAESAYKLGNTLISKQDQLVSGFAGDRTRLTDAIKAAFSDLAGECYTCSKNADPDT